MITKGQKNKIQNLHMAIHTSIHYIEMTFVLGDKRKTHQLHESDCFTSLKKEI